MPRPIKRADSPKPRKPTAYDVLAEEREINRRVFLRGTGAIAGIGVIGWFAKRFFGEKPAEKKPSAKPKKSAPSGSASKKPFSEKRREPVRKPPEPLKPREKTLLHYREGLSGKALADAYGVPYTQKWFVPREMFRENPGFHDLVHDINVLVAEKCAKYNSKCEINPQGTPLVDPYEVLAIIERESGYNPNAYRSAANDRGLGQIIPAQEKTLREMRKMPVDIKDFYDPAQNIEGIVRTLAWLAQNPANKEKQTTWRRFASYNAGRGGAKGRVNADSSRYANEVTNIWNRLRAENVLKPFYNK